MIQIQTICLVLCMSAYCMQADKYTDENRPYEFGFTIEGEQHRHEKKGIEINVTIEKKKKDRQRWTTS